jgi:hypothetical protein
MSYILPEEAVFPKVVGLVIFFFGGGGVFETKAC